ncbi:alpha-L-rhamnosidase-related protein [Dysgonomonas macrotermitis]|nr:family 78 glycoside hydrolase catalytic domain [Dysgonomonas macrotermitis]
MRKLIVSMALLCLACVINAQDYYKTHRESWLKKAEEAKPELFQTTYSPQYLVKSVADPIAFQGWKMERFDDMSYLYDQSFKKVKEVIVDFGKHMTGFYTFHLKTTDKAQDAPIRIKFTFAEVPAELNTSLDPWKGTLSRAWMQDEIITVSQIDQDITIPRRISGRYMKIELLAAPPDFDFALTNMYFTAYSSAKEVKTTLQDNVPQDIREINDVAIETLRECMQTVYEDGPKRDMRLWIGDLYLESLANMYSFQNHELTKRCLYLLAGLAAEDGNLHANIFEKPEPHPQYSSYCLSYNLLYNVTLLEYLKASGDMETAKDLWPVVKRQVEDAMSYLDENNIFNQNKKGYVWLFFDWRDGLDVSTPMQGLMIFALDKSYELAKILNKEDEVRDWPLVSKNMAKAARKELYDKNRGIFLSGSNNQISSMSQIWMIISGVLNQKESQKALKTTLSMDDAVYPGTPYAYHYLIEAMVACGMNEEAKEYMRSYWGAMVKKGADTFWEQWDPENEFLSPYNFFPVNSYCHAWSCTPVYFIHKYPEVFQK